MNYYFKKKINFLEINVIKNIDLLMQVSYTKWEKEKNFIMYVIKYYIKFFNFKFIFLFILLFNLEKEFRNLFVLEIRKNN
jgi:hypothetical protein